ncbi:hypothetical protein IEZ26_06745 [Nocardioides cavernae]|uniref:Uncharacterized protein n=1 Tax=Nocardioides cavernae TaxID=1921566 RepID=A0ABR8NBR9_9ACTN|nr:hypothetical protein [Nocardioides cavernae]MBD3924314.1 hypothetical protein [Nocardioides cavernae]MBM7510743.1 hypothetical protein [Nocardioides cavernae]
MMNHQADMSIPPLRLRYFSAEDVILDLAWSDDPNDEDPLSIAFLAKNATNYQVVDERWDVEDPTDPENDEYPPNTPSVLSEVDFVRCAVSHWQRVHPRMPRFTEAELETPYFMAALGNVRGALSLLVKSRPGTCSFVVEERPY